MYKKGLLLLIFILLMKTDVFAGSMDTNSRVVFYENASFDEDTRDKFFFLFSNITFKHSYSGNIYLVNSYMTADGDYDGDVYCFFSSATVSGVHNGRVYDLTSPVILIPLKILILLIIFASKNSFFEQGSMEIVYNPIKVMRNGLLIYFIFIAVTCIFLISVVGFPISVLAMITLYVFIMFGEISLAIFIGYLLLKRTNHTYSYANLMAGVIIIEVIGYIPVICMVVDFLIIPIICLGIFSCTIIDGYIKKIFYTLPYRVHVHAYDRTDMSSDLNIRKKLLGSIMERKVL